MTLSVDLFWSFRSPYSYLALARVGAIVAQYDVSVHARPVYPLAVRDPGFFQRTDPRFVRYVVLDSQRVAQQAGIAFRFPRPDPIVQDLQTLRVAAEQPRIRRLMRLGAAAQRRGQSLPLIDELSRLLWDGSVDGWDQGDHVQRAVARAGLDPTVLEREAIDDADALEAVIAENERAHASSGHWGVPTFVFEGEPFFGQDRIDLLLWRLQQRGLQRRHHDSQEKHACASGSMVSPG
jgi:2-hydroxychromene-2-carboxylate isomerase